MGRLLDYAEQAEEIVRLVMNDGYSIDEAIKLVKEKAIKDTDQSSPR